MRNVSRLKKIQNHFFNKIGKKLFFIHPVSSVSLRGLQFMLDFAIANLLFQ